MARQTASSQLTRAMAAAIAPMAELGRAMRLALIITPPSDGLRATFEQLSESVTGGMIVPSLRTMGDQARHQPGDPDW